MRAMYLSTVSLVAAGAMAVPGTSMAQQAPEGSAAAVPGPSLTTQVTRDGNAASDASSQEIVVTAQKREQSLQDVPLAIQAFGGDKLLQQGIKSASDVLMQVPSASFATYSPTQAILQLRGVSQNPAVDPSVAYYVDEIPLGFPGYPYAPNVDALDLARVEVLRGPQGTLYGLGAMGGTLRVITNDPSLTEGQTLRFTGETSWIKGGDQNYLGSVAANVPLVDDKLAARVSLSYRHNGGFVDDSGRGTRDVNSDNSFSLRTKLLYKPMDDLTVKLTLWRNEVDTKWSNITSERNGKTMFRNGASGPDMYSSLHFTVLAGFVSYDLGFATVENGLSYYRGNSPSRVVVGTPIGLFVDDTVDRSKATTNEFRIVSNGDTAFQWIAGVFYRDARRAFSENSTFGGFPLAVNASQDVRSQSYSIFGELSYGFWDNRVRALVGGRYFHDKRRTLLQDASGVQLDVSPKFHSFNPRFNLTFQPNKDLTIYANVAKGFRSGSNNNAGQIAGAALEGITGIEVVNPDSIWTYELGAKASLLDRKVFIEGAMFYSDWSDIQVQGATPVGFSFTVNGGDVRIKGVEGSITWHTPLHGLSLNASGSYTDSEYARVSPLVAAVSPLFVRGARLPTIPRYSGVVGANYDTPLGDNGLSFTAGGSLTFRGGQTDASGGDFDPATPGVQPIATQSRRELSLRAGVRKDGWELTVFANNVTNNLRSVSSLTALQWYAPVPRTIGLRLSGEL